LFLENIHRGATLHLILEHRRIYTHHGIVSEDQNFTKFPGRKCADNIERRFDAPDFVSIKSLLLEKEDDGGRIDDQDFDSHPHRTPQRRRKLWHIAGLFLLIFLAIIGLINIILGAYRYLKPNAFDLYKSMISDCSCGSTIEEALAMNCTFDVWAEAWVPPKCQDKFLKEKFNVAGPGINGSWPYFLDREGTQPVSLDELETMLGRTIYTSRGWHVAHCLFYWIKEWRARELGRKMEETYFSMYHVQHCVTYILETHGEDWDTLTGQFDLKLTSRLRPELKEEQQQKIWELS
jgi:hypothetical protein